jgi:methionyl-tRNA formyltransferase
VPALRALAATTEVVGVISKPDRPAGRGLRLAEPAVKLEAIALGLEVHQPIKVKTGRVHEWLAERRVEAVLVMAYGRILPPAVLQGAPKGCLNLHASLLPKYRGAAPINWAIIRGESETGISLMQMDQGMDTGPVYTMRRLAISQEETAGDLAARLADLAATVVREDFPHALGGRSAAEPQDEALATHAPPIIKEMTVIDWSRSALDVSNLVRGLAPRPGAQTRVRGKVLKILAASVAQAGAGQGAPGEIMRSERGEVRVATGAGTVQVQRAQLEGRKPLDARDLVNGRIVVPGDHFES